MKRRDSVCVGLAEYVVVDDGRTLLAPGIGSCVVLALFDGAVAGMAHVMLPEANGKPVDSPAKYADTAIPAMLATMDECGADPDGIEAKIAGGSAIFGFEGVGADVGLRNVETIREQLSVREIPLIAEDVEGDYGRTIAFDTETGTLTIRTADGTPRKL